MYQRPQRLPAARPADPDQIPIVAENSDVGRQLATLLSEVESHLADVSAELKTRKCGRDLVAFGRPMEPDTAYTLAGRNNSDWALVNTRVLPRNTPRWVKSRRKKVSAAMPRGDFARFVELGEPLRQTGRLVPRSSLAPLLDRDVTEPRAARAAIKNELTSARVLRGLQVVRETAPTMLLATAKVGLKSAGLILTAAASVA